MFFLCVVTIAHTILYLFKKNYFLAAQNRNAYFFFKKKRTKQYQVFFPKNLMRVEA